MAEESVQSNQGPESTIAQNQEQDASTAKDTANDQPPATGNDNATDTETAKDDKDGEEKGTDPNARLLEAAEKGDEAGVIAALAGGADIEAKSPSGFNETALHLAARFGHEAIAKILLEKNASVASRDNEKWIPLYGAAIEGHTAIVGMLLDRESEINAQTQIGWTPIMAAARHNQQEAAKLLINRGADINIVGDELWPPLAIACRYSTTEIVQLLMDKGANIDKQDDLGWPPLHYATWYGNKDMVHLLLEKGADIDLVDGDGWAAVHKISSNDKEEDRKAITKMLLDRNPKLPVTTDDNKHTPLHIACCDGYADVVESFLKTDIDINAPDSTDWTALHQACYKGFGDVVQLLLAKGARVDLKTTDTDQTAMTLAVLSLEDIHKEENTNDEERSKKRESAMFAIKALSRDTNMTEKRVSFRQIPIQEDIDRIGEQMGFKQTEIEDNRLIWFAARQEKHDELCTLLKKAPDDTKTEVEPNTPLQLAAYHGNHVVVWWLLKTTLPDEQADRDRKQAQSIAEERRNKLPKAAKVDEQVADEKRDRLDGKDTEPSGGNKGRTGTDANPRPRKAGPDEEDRYSLTLDMLRDPPPVAGISDLDESYDRPVVTKAIKDEIEGYDATVIDFYRRDGRSGRVDFLRRSRKVWGVVYDETAGPEQIMQDARTTLEKISPEDAKEKKYSRDDLQMRWIHLPANNMDWMRDLARRIYLDKDKKKEDYLPLGDFIRRSWQELPTTASRTKFMKPACLKEKENTELRHSDAIQRSTASDDNEKKPAPEPPESHETKQDGGSKEAIDKKKSDGNSAPGDEAPIKETKSGQKKENYERVAVYMPYITFGQCSRESHQPPSREKYEKLMKSYQGNTMHGSRSLDEFYYHSLPDMSARNENQVATRFLLGGENGKGVKNKDSWPILTVDQLWLWVIDEETIITASTHRKDGFEDPVLERIFNHLREAKGKGNGQPPPASVAEMSKFIVNFCIGFINTVDWKSSTPDGSVDTINDEVCLKSAREIFADTINIKAAKEKELFTAFTDKMDRKRNESHQLAKIGEINGKHGEETKDWTSISDAAKLLDEVKDIRDELGILKSLLTQQETVWKGLLGESSKMEDERGPTYTLNEIEEMNKMAEAIQTSVNDILGLEQNGINITEAVLARDQAVESARQGKTLMVFTIVTIVFTPMSFLSSLFALNVSSFQHDSQGNLAYSPTWIFPMIFCVSVAITIPLMVTAAYVEEVRKFLEGLIGKRKVSHQAITTTGNGNGHPPANLIPQPIAPPALTATEKAQYDIKSDVESLQMGKVRRRGLHLW